MVKKIVIGLLGLMGISLVAQTQYGLFLTVGSSISYTNIVSTNPQGDTLSILWGPTSDGTTVYNANDGNGDRTINGVMYTPLSDANVTGCNSGSANSFLAKIDKLSFATPSQTLITKVNCMLDFGTGTDDNAPVGWFGMNTSGGTDVNATSHIQRGWSMQGYRFYFVQRGYTGDVSIIMSPPDDTAPMATWFNYAHAYKYTISMEACTANVITLTISINTMAAGNKIWVHGANTNNGVKTVSAASATTVSYAETCTTTVAVASGGTVGIGSTGGDMPRCDAISVGTACLNTEYTTSMIWRGAADSNTVTSMVPFVYGQDGGGTGPNGSSTYFYAMGYSSYQFLHRILISDLIGGSFGDPTKWSHYACSIYTVNSVCDGTAAGSWVSNVQLATPVTQVAIGINATGQNEGPIIYLTGTGSYHQLVDIFTRNTSADQLAILSSPTPWGPWKVDSLSPIAGGNYTTRGFPTFIFPLAIATSSTQYTIPMLSDNTTVVAPGDPTFQQMTLNYRHPPTNRQFNNTISSMPVDVTSATNPITMIGHTISSLTQWIMTFVDGNPNQSTLNLATDVFANVDSPVAGGLCTTSVTSGGGSFVPTFSNSGIVFPNGNNIYFPRCVTDTNIPFTGDGAISITEVFNQTSTGIEQCHWNYGSYNNGGGAWTFCIRDDGSSELVSAGNQSNQFGSTPFTLGIAQAVTVVKSGAGSNATTLNVYVNGMYYCGASRGTKTACAGYATDTLNIVASPLRIGELGTADAGGCTAGPCAYQKAFVGTFYKLDINAKAFSDGEVKANYNALKLQMARRGVTLP